MDEEEIFHRMICAWNNHEPDKAPRLSPANESTKQGWLRVFRAAQVIIEEEANND